MALLIDAYRELNSKKLFWITMILSGVVVAAFAAIGINENGLTLLWYEIGDFNGFMTSATVPPDQLYKLLFANFGITFWLSWIATILALVSTSSMIPDFIASGAIELTLSKPIGRLRLFLTKFVMGLLFVGLQVLTFSAACFVVIGVRGGAWEPGVFLAVPVVLLFFSYLFSVCVLFGLLTRSTIASLLLTLLFWFVCFGINATEVIILNGRESNAVLADSLETRIGRMEANTTRLLRPPPGDASTDPTVPTDPRAPLTPEELNEANPRLVEARSDLAKLRKNYEPWDTAAKVFVAAKTVLPKTAETVDLIDRWLVKEMDLSGLDGDDEADANPNADAPAFARLSRTEREKVTRRLDKIYKTRSVAWVVGTSLLFELVVLGLAARMFVRRDF